MTTLFERILITVIAVCLVVTLALGSTVIAEANHSATETISAMLSGKVAAK